jgi:nitrogen fixation protein FixH
MATGSETSMTGPTDGYRLTGRHVLVWLIAFFGVVFVVNFTMMHYAVSTFSGLEDDSPYKNGLAYNTDLDAARRQNERGWHVEARMVRGSEGDLRFAIETTDAARAALSGLDGVMRLERPADRRFDHEVEIAPVGSGRYEAVFGTVEPGQWDAVIELRSKGEKQFVSRNRIILK